MSREGGRSGGGPERQLALVATRVVLVRRRKVALMSAREGKHTMWALEYPASSTVSKPIASVALRTWEPNVRMANTRMNGSEEVMVAEGCGERWRA
jgi:hypothetical protein